MADMLRRCMDWMMSLGWVGMLVGVLLLIALLVFVVVLIRRIWRGTRG